MIEWKSTVYECPKIGKQYLVVTDIGKYYIADYTENSLFREYRVYSDTEAYPIPNVAFYAEMNQIKYKQKQQENFIAKKCKHGADACCDYVGNSGCCSLPEDEDCINQIVSGVKCSDVETADDKNKIKLCCDEITLTKDSVGIEVNIQNLIQNIDKFETIEVNGRVFKRVRKE